MLHSDPSLLVPEAYNKCMAFLEGCKQSKLLQERRYVAIILETLRELAVQMAYYSRSRMGIIDVQAMFRAAGLWMISSSEASKPSTWTLESKHLKGKAFDSAPSKDGVNPDWQAPPEVWEEMHQIARSVGLLCGADFKLPAKPDGPHYEIA